MQIQSFLTMPVVKQKLIRHQTLDSCFRSNKNYYIENLLEACNRALERYDCTPVSLRTIRYDLNEFETLYHVNIEHIKDASGHVYYKYEDLNFSIRQLPLTEEELAALKDTVLMLSRIEGLPQFEWMEELLTKVEVEMHQTEHSTNVVSFDANQYVTGLKYLEPLFNYIVSRQAIEVDYQPFDKPEIHWTLSPYHIKQYNNRWFLLAANEQGQIMNVALDRILDIQPSEAKYQPTDIDFSEYFDDVIGVTIPQDCQPEHILLRFAPHRLPYVLSKPLHPSQKTKDKKHGLIEITVIPNRELESLIFSFGNDVEVLQPETLREQIAEKIAKMHNLYK